MIFQFYLSATKIPKYDPQNIENYIQCHQIYYVSITEAYVPVYSVNSNWNEMKVVQMSNLSLLCIVFKSSYDEVSFE